MRGYTWVKEHSEDQGLQAAGLGWQVTLADGAARVWCCEYCSQQRDSNGCGGACLCSPDALPPLPAPHLHHLRLLQLCGLQQRPQAGGGRCLDLHQPCRGPGGGGGDVLTVSIRDNNCLLSRRAALMRTC